MKKFVLFVSALFVLFSLVGCKQKSCYLCESSYTGKTYDYPTIGGPPENICKKCYEKYMCFKCDECHKVVEGDYHSWPAVTLGTANDVRKETVKLCDDCFYKKLDME